MYEVEYAEDFGLLTGDQKAIADVEAVMPLFKKPTTLVQTEKHMINTLSYLIKKQLIYKLRASTLAVVNLREVGDDAQLAA